MKKQSVLVTCAVFAAALLLPGATSAQLVPGAPNTDWEREHNEFTLGVLKEFNGILTQWREALNGGRGDVAAAQYAPGAQLLVSGRTALLGRDSIAAFLKEFAATLVEIRVAPAEFHASDKLAYSAGPLILARRDSAGGPVRSYNGRHVTVLQRDGRRWRILSQVLHFTAAESGGAAPTALPFR